MRSSYKRIGDYIALVDIRNKGLEVTNLVGLSITKQFIKSVANTIGTDMENYKIIHRNQFACSIMQVRRDKKMPLALYTDEEPAIISQAYPVFKIINEEELLPEYLMMWFTRSEFDRHACFLAVGGVRGSLEWDDFLDMELPVPDIEKQREIVNEYNTIVNRITLNEQLNQKLEETAQTLYKHWFVDFEFPNENGQPYKSSGGKMVYNEDLDQQIPNRFKSLELKDVTDMVTDGAHASPASVKVGIPMSSVKDMHAWGLNLTSSRQISKEDYIKLVKGNCKPLLGDILIAKDGSYLKHVFVTKKEEDVAILSSIALLRPNGLFIPDLLSIYLKLDETKRRMTSVVTGGAIQRIILKEFKKIRILIPNQEKQEELAMFITPLVERCWMNTVENSKLLEMKHIMLSRMAKINSQKVEQVI